MFESTSDKKEFYVSNNYIEWGFYQNIRYRFKLNRKKLTLKKLYTLNGKTSVVVERKCKVYQIDNFINKFKTLIKNYQNDADKERIGNKI